MDRSALVSLVLLVSVTYTAAQPASAGGDCLVTGFNGETSAIAGVPSHTYRLLETANLTVNIELVSAGPQHSDQPGKGNFIGGVSVLGNDLALYAHETASGNMSVTVNGLEMDTELPARFNNGLLSYAPYLQDFGQVITFQDEVMRLAIVAVKPFADKASGHIPGHLDLHAKILGDSELKADGILGVTLGRPSSNEGDDAEANSVIDGRAFEVSSLSDKSMSAAAAVVAAGSAAQ